MKKNTFNGKKVLVLGLGVSGLSAAEFLLDRGATVFGLEDNLEKLRDNSDISRLCNKGLKISQDSTSVNFEGTAMVVASPGVPRTHPAYRKARESGVEVIGEIELACREINGFFLGITGTNGKTTVSMMIGHVLNFCGKKASVLGNAGIPLTRISHTFSGEGGQDVASALPSIAREHCQTDKARAIEGKDGATDCPDSPRECEKCGFTSQFSGQMPEFVVCELSSYQLETLSSKVIDCGVILNITPDHLDRYEGMIDYARAKINMGRCVKPSGHLLVGKAVFDAYQKEFEGIKPRTFGFDPSCDVYCDKKSIFIKENIELLLPNDYRGKSSHDVENIMAAFALCHEVGVTADLFAKALESFVKPPHRIEFVRSIGGVNFYNDSKGTNLDAVIRAVESMPGKVILIAGGQGKGTAFAPWLEAFGDKVRYICAIGEARKAIETELSKKYDVRIFNSMETAVDHAFVIAQEGNNVLLSPGCASFDMFNNFEHRGDRFKEIVHALEG